MCSYIETSVIIILIVLAIIYLYTMNISMNEQMNKSIENFETYSYGPFNYMDSGSDPLTFYRYPIYRNPFMYPYKFYSSYPYPYMTYYPTNI
jgi:hypothetical protein